VHEAERLEIEFIVVHDKHDDKTSTQLCEIQSDAKAKNFKLFESVFNSPGLARNRGLVEASGEWIAFWDSDDQPNPEKFVEMVSLGKLNRTDIVIGNFSVLAKSLENQSRGKLTKSKKLQLISSPGLWRMAFKSTIAKECRFIPSLMGEDQVYLVDLKLFDRKIYWYKGQVYKYKTGEATQLTAAYKNIDFLHQTVGALLERRESLSSEKSNFGMLVLYKLLLTGILRGNLKLKIRFLRLGVISSQIGVRRMLKRS
jgi:glycosyltransferase involved in cell wall biosynthesis